MTFEQMWADLAPVGRSARSGGYFRQPFTSAEEEAQAWFLAEAERRDLRVETDGFGNQVAWWGRPDGDGVLTGSHLDSVLDGGAYDGPLGVVSAFAAIDVLRERGVRPERAIGVVSFREEEGSRFPLACLGSRLATGVLAWEDARELRDRDGVALADVVPGPEKYRRALDLPSWTTSASSSSCTWNRGETSCTVTARWPWLSGSGRTAATASTSPVVPTTPARPGWRTATTRC